MHRGCRKPCILEDNHVAHHSRHHRVEAEILGRERPREYHDRQEIKNKLNALRSDGDNPTGDRPAPDIAQQMISAKIFFLRLDPFTRRIRHANDRNLTISKTTTGLTHHWLLTFASLVGLSRLKTWFAVSCNWPTDNHRANLHVCYSSVSSP